MSTIPTSLIIVFLVAAWLVVLVPMVARRREQVPETETDGGTFRVLRMASASIRRRPKLGPRNAVQVEDDFVAEPVADELSESEFDDADFENEDREALRTAGSTRYEPGSYRSDVRTISPELETEPDSYRTEYVPRAPIERDESMNDRGQGYDRLRTLDEAQLRPVPRRSGRGGYDPDAAEAARAYRFSRRRRVTLILVLAALVFGAAAYLYKPILWSVAVVFGLLTVGYLTYLRRQVRIENEIQQRRDARLRRARQIRPEQEMAFPEDAGAGYTVAAHPFSGRPVVVSQVPPSGYRRGREVIDLEDDDPTFDDLEYYLPEAYRRASGQ